MELNFDKATYNDFLALLFIYSASIDLEFTDDEKEIIIKKVGKDVFDINFKKFKQLKDIEVTNLLYELSQKFCSTPDQKQLAIDDINEVIHVNGKRNRTEEDMLHFINKII